MKIRGVYGFSLKAGSFRGKTPVQAARKLKQWNINAVFTPFMERKNIKTLSKQGIQVFVDMTCFQGDEHWKVHPKSRPINSEGNAVQKIKWYAPVCPSQEWLRESIKEKVSRTASQKEIEGIWLDFIRYPVHWEVPKPKIEQSCFCALCLSKFQKESGITVPADLKNVKQKASWILGNHKDEWIDWKCRNIAGFVKEVRDSIKAVNPDCLVGLFGVPWKADEESREIAGQDYKLLGEVVDVISPMVYYPLVQKPKAWAAEIIQYVSTESGRPVWPILYAGDPQHPVSFEEIQSGVRLVSESGAEGVLVISFNELVSKGYVQKLFLAEK